jgi:hypothetical protein
MINESSSADKTESRELDFIFMYLWFSEVLEYAHSVKTKACRELSVKEKNGI